MSFLEYVLYTIPVVVVVYLLYLMYSNQNKKFSYWRDRGVPYVEPQWLFGSIRSELFKQSSWVDFSTKCYDKFKDNGFGGIFLFSKPALVVCDPNLAEMILIQNFTSFHDRNESKFDEPMMKTLFNAHGEIWRIMRSKLIPSFTTARVKSMFEQVLNCCELTVKQIEGKMKSSNAVDVGSLMFEYSTEVIASCAFGIQLLSNVEQRNKFKRAIDKMFSFNIVHAIRIAVMLGFPKMVELLGREFVFRSVSGFFISLTKGTIQYRKQNNIRRNDFLNLLMELQDQEEGGLDFLKGIEMHEEDKTLSSLMKNVPLASKCCHNERIFTDDRIAALVFNFITGGLKPSVSVISFALLEVAKDPTIQEEVVAEVDYAIKKHKGWSYEAVRDMTYLDKVIEETLRMYSLSTVLMRVVTEPYTLPGTTLTLEKDLLVYIPINPLHMDPQHHPSPRVFNPDRFSDTSYKPTSTFMPFGNGPRICIAMKFATMMMKVCLARVLFEYSVSVNEKTQLPLVFVKDEVFPKPIGGIWLNFCKRKTTA